MKKISKKAAAVTLVGVMAMGALTGCGEKNVDGTKTVATVDGTEVPMGILSLMVRESQAQAEAMYASFMGGSTDYQIWNTEVEDGGMTYGEQAVQESLESLELMYILKEKAADYKVEVTEDDQKAIAEAASKFMGDNTEETLEILGVTEDQVKTYLELKTYEQRMHDPIVADADTNVTDEEAQQSSFTYVSINTNESDDDEKKNQKEDAQKLLDEMKKDPSADFDAAAKKINDKYVSLSGTFDTKADEETDEDKPEDESSSNIGTSSYPDEVLKVLRTLKDGEMGPDVIETDTGYYVVRLDKKIDEEATADKKDSLIEVRKENFYTETTDKWKEDAKITEDKKVIKTLKVKDNHKFNMATTTDTAADDTTTAEVTEAPAEATTAPETTEAADGADAAAEATETPAADEADAAAEATETPAADSADAAEATETPAADDADAADSADAAETTPAATETPAADSADAAE